MPTDKKNETDRALSLRGLVCDETVINLLPDELDASSEIEKMKTQSEESLETNIKKIESFGKDESDTQVEESNNQDAKETKNASNTYQDSSVQNS